MEFGGNEHNMGLARNFFPDGTGNHGIGGIQSTLIKTGLIDINLFVLENRLARTKFGG
jgi:hypothetical protein